MRRVSATHWQHSWRVSDAELLEADVVPTGIAVGAHYEWLNDRMGPANLQHEWRELSEFWERVRTQAHQELLRIARSQGNGVLAHVNFSQAFKRERDQQPPLSPRAPYRGCHDCRCAPRGAAAP